MIQAEHLQIYELTLTTRSPLHVGSGKVYSKIDYLFNKATQKVSILDQDALFQLLIDRNLIDRYEAFALGGEKRLYEFLKWECHLTPAELGRITRYSLRASDALDGSHSLKEICAFQRLADGQPYIPGSCIKGALRTVFLADRMHQQKPAGLYHLSEDRKGYRMAGLEGEYLNTLHLKRNKKTGMWENDPVNSLFRGISVADSRPIPESAMILCGKLDVSPYGEIKALPILRECVRPGTTLQLQLTLDQSILKGRVTKDSLMEQIQKFDQFYLETYARRFRAPADAVQERYHDCLILGGGAGFFSKTVVYPALGDREGLRFTSRELQSQFRQHKHDKDIDLGISPHKLKYARYNGSLYPYGVCGVSIQ